MRCHPSAYRMMHSHAVATFPAGPSAEISQWSSNFRRAQQEEMRISSRRDSADVELRKVGRAVAGYNRQSIGEVPHGCLSRRHSKTPVYPNETALAERSTKAVIFLTGPVAGGGNRCNFVECSKLPAK